jgi:uncharacterized protein (TIGR02246 family)
MLDLDSTLSRFCDAWNRHDADALASLWTDDGELNHPWGTRAVGRVAIRELLEEEHRGAMAGSLMRIERFTPVTTGPNVVAEIESVLEDVAAPNGRRYSIRPRISAMFVPDGAEWRIRTMTPLPQ